MANATSVLSCKDSPLAIVSDATGFLTTLVAVALAYYAFLNIFQTAPRAYLDFVDDLETFYYQSDSLLEEFGEMRVELITYILDNTDFHNFESLMDSFSSKTDDIKQEAHKIKDKVGDPTAKAGRTFEMKSGGPTLKKDMKEIKGAGFVCIDLENPSPGLKCPGRTKTFEEREARQTEASCQGTLQVYTVCCQNLDRSPLVVAAERHCERRQGGYSFPTS